MSTSKSNQFDLVNEKGWKRGLGNLLKGEISVWFNSSKWWKQMILWFLIVNMMMIIMIFATGEAAKDGGSGPPILFMYGIFGGMFVAFGVMIIMQRTIIGEKKSGTAEWVLSKPVTRTAFVVSRLLVNTIGILLTSVFVPGIILYFTLGTISDIGWLSPLGFIAALVMVAIHAFFWITLVIMMGTLSDSPGQVISVPLALYFTLWMGSGTIPGLAYVSPLLLCFNPDDVQYSSLAFSLMTGEPVFSWVPLLVTTVLSAVFIGIAILRYNKQEF
jgi:ABC-2 type transport system permease protein